MRRDDQGTERMTDTPDTTDAPRKKGGLVTVLLAVGLFALGGAGGYFAVQSGVLPFGDAAPAAAGTPDPAADVAFLPIDPIVVSLGPAASNRHLSFRAQLEVPQDAVGDVAAIMPRIVDILNGFLRAVDAREFDDPAGLIRMRAQMLRRVQAIAGEGQVRDVLVMEFVLN